MQTHNRANAKVAITSRYRPVNFIKDNTIKREEQTTDKRDKDILAGDPFQESEKYQKGAMGLAQAKPVSTIIFKEVVKDFGMELCGITVA
jgi:hypothetical protein